MARVLIVAVGRLKAGPERDLAERYRTRFEQAGRGIGLAGLVLREIGESPARDAAERKAREADAIRSALPEAAAVVLLDERGTMPDSTAFAQMIRRNRDAGRATTFVMGGPDGLDGHLRAEAETIVSFGAMTLPHQLVRILLLEQLYRAATILGGHPYHRA